MDVAGCFHGPRFSGVEAARSKLCSGRTTAGAGDRVSFVTVICSAACTDWVGQAFDPHGLDKRRNFLSKLDVFAAASIVFLGGGKRGPSASSYAPAASLRGQVTVRPM